MLLGRETVGRVGSRRTPWPPIAGSTYSTWASSRGLPDHKIAPTMMNGERYFFMMLSVDHLVDYFAAGNFGLEGNFVAQHFARFAGQPQIIIAGHAFVVTKLNASRGI